MFKKTQKVQNSIKRFFDDRTWTNQISLGPTAIDTCFFDPRS
jgi:hypothetical protein